MRESTFPFVGSPSVMAGDFKVTGGQYHTSTESSTRTPIVLLTNAERNYLDAAWFRCSTEAQASGGAWHIGSENTRILSGSERWEQSCIGSGFQQYEHISKQES